VLDQELGDLKEKLASLTESSRATISELQQQKNRAIQQYRLYYKEAQECHELVAFL
jgi:hypothetical protein